MKFCTCGSIIKSDGTCSNPHCGHPADIQWSKTPDYKLAADIRRGTPLVRAPVNFGHASVFGTEKNRTGGALAWRMEC
jgi:hypothetical protein